MPFLDVRRPIIFVSAITVGILATWYLLVDNSPTSNPMGSIPARQYSFESVKGFFLQDDPATNQTDFHYEAVNFGLIDRAYDTDTPGDAGLTQWQRFAVYVRHLIETSPADTTYKLIYNGRHGEGYHNVGEAKYGTQAWNDYWSKLDGDGELYWFDAHLTEKGTQQALHNHAFLKRQFAQEQMPAPQKYYSSPLYRCLQTANLTYLHLDVPADAPFTPTIKEMMREVMGEHTCDKRSSKAVIHKAVPSWNIETGFAEEDELWRPDHRETFAEHDARTHALLEDIFEHDSHAVMSFTSHSGAIASLLRVIGHREFGLPTGALIPLLVRATRTQ